MLAGKAHLKEVQTKPFHEKEQADEDREEATDIGKNINYFHIFSGDDMMKGGFFYRHLDFIECLPCNIDSNSLVETIGSYSFLITETLPWKYRVVGYNCLLV